MTEDEISQAIADARAILGDPPEPLIPPRVWRARQRVVLLAERPADPERPTVEELDAGTDLGCVVTYPGFHRD